MSTPSARPQPTPRDGAAGQADVYAWLAHALVAHLAHYRDPAAREAAVGLLPPPVLADAALDQQAADRTRPPKRKELRSLSELRDGWRTSAIRAFDVDTVYRLAERVRAAAAAVWARVRPVVDIALAAVDTVAVVYVMRGAQASAPARRSPPSGRSSAAGSVSVAPGCGVEPATIRAICSSLRPWPL